MDELIPKDLRLVKPTLSETFNVSMQQYMEQLQPQIDAMEVNEERKMIAKQRLVENYQLHRKKYDRSITIYEHLMLFNKEAVIVDYLWAIGNKMADIYYYSQLPVKGGYVVRSFARQWNKVFKPLKVIDLVKYCCAIGIYPWEFTYNDKGGIVLYPHAARAQLYFEAKATQYGSADEVIRKHKRGPYVSLDELLPVVVAQTETDL